MFKVPAKTVDFGLMKQYETKETLRVTQSKNSVIIDITSNNEDGYEYGKPATEINKFVSLRDDIMAGDYRCLYIAWLAQYRSEDEKYKIPLIPSGMKKLTGTLSSFADFMYLDDDTLKTAIQSTDANELKKPTLKEIKTWVAALPENTKQKVIVDLLQEKKLVQNIQRELRKQFIDALKKCK